MTTATGEAISEADRYLKEVAPHLAGLPAEDRAELLEDLALHLAEVAAEPGPPLEERLGPPAAYAAELLATAGVEVTPPGRRSVRASAGAWRARLRQTAAGREAARAWPAVRTAWWVVRAWVAVYLLTEIERGGGGYHGFPVPELFGNPLAGLAALAIAVPVSIRFGQANLRGLTRLAVIAGNAVLVVYALAAAGHIGPREVRFIDTGGRALPFPLDPCLRDGNGQPITNLYAYDTSGKLLDPVLLYDQNGQPVDNLCPDFDGRGRRLTTQYGRDANGAAVANAFPRKQAVTQPGVPAVTAPVNPPAVVIPKLATTTTTPTTTPPASVP